MLKYLITALILIAPLSAYAVGSDPVDVKNSVMQNCLGNGGDRTICECSYNFALKTMTLDDIALLQSQLASHVQPDSALMSKFGHATEECAKPGVAAKNSTATSNADDAGSIALPPPPPPPMGGDAPSMLDSSGTSGKTGGSTYLSDIKPDVKKAPVQEDASAEPPSEVTAAPKTKTLAPKSERVSTKKRPNGYFTEFDNRFFDAARRGDMDALRAYATKVYDFNAYDQSGDTPLIASVKAGQAVSVNFLVASGANVNLKNLSGQAAIHVASYMRRPDIVETLIDGKAKINEAYGNGYTPLVLAIMQQDLSTVQLLLQHHSGFSRSIPNGNTELHLAASGQNPAILQALVAAGAKVNQKNKAGLTPLMIASYTDNLQNVQALMALHADPRIKDPTGRTALALANAAGKTDIVNALMQYQR